MKKATILAVILVVMMTGAYGQTTATLTGRIVDPSNAGQSVNTVLLMTLKKCEGNAPRVNGAALIWPVVKKYWTDASGNVSGTIIRSDAISCGGSTDSNVWEMVVGQNGQLSPPCMVRITAATFDASQPNCLNSTPPAPTVSDTLTFARIDAANLPFTGHVRAPKFADVRYADQFAGATTALRVAAACADLGGGPGVVTVPSSLASGDLSGALVSKCPVWDYRGTGAMNDGPPVNYTTSNTKGVGLLSRWTDTNANPSTFFLLNLSADAYTGGNNVNGTKANYILQQGVLNARTSGQVSGISSFINHLGTGDAQPLVSKIYTSGGIKSGNGDEGQINLRASFHQNTGIFTATVTSVNGNVITYSSASNPGFLGAGRFLINKTTGVYSTGTASATGTTVTGIGTTWSVANLPGIGTANAWAFSLDSEEVSGSKYLNPVAARVSDTSLTLTDSWSSNASTAAGAYKLYKSSEVTAVDPDNNTITVSDGTRFQAGDSIELPNSNRVSPYALFADVNQVIASAWGGPVGIALQNGNSNLRGKFYSSFQMVGNTERFLLLSGHTLRPNYGIFFNTGPAPGSWIYAADNVNDSTHNIFTLCKNYVTSACDGGTWTMAYNKNGNGLSFSGQSTTTFTAAAGSTDPFTVRDSSAVPFLRITNFDTIVNNGLNLRGYSDNQSTNKWSIIGSSGNFSTAGSVQIGSGTAIVKVVKYAASLTPASVATVTCADQDFTVTGLITADIVMVNGPAITAGVAPTAWRVKAADTLTGTFCNPTAGSLTPASGTYNVTAVRF